LIQFSGGAEKKLFKDVDDYVQNYPAIPYQVNLLGKVLNEIRNHSASGRSMSEGERSMLGFFQKAVQQIEDENTEHFIAFDQFYDSVQANLDDSHQRVIVQAGENSLIQENKDINLRVLKVLLLIKYLPQEIHATVGNITSLLIRSITEDRLSLQK
ncbi:BREX system P-loop protein BrxC, partial [Weissella cibaria]|nr:BREX system P-loop protein BrxC [Weissella cibaria]